MSELVAIQSESSASRERPRASRFRLGDALVRGFVTGCGGFVLLATLLMLGFIGRTGIQGIREVGLWSLLTGELWKPETNLFGGLPLIVGTVVSACGALVVGALPAVLAAVWVTEFAPPIVKAGYRRTMEITAAVPSVVYGWLALIHLVPIMERVAHGLHGEDAVVSGEGLAASSVLLGMMIMPTVLLLSLDALSRVPQGLRDASAALGASHWQTAFRVALPYAWSGILIAVFFGFARAAGETMAVQMVVGGARKLAPNAFSPTTTISTQIVMDMQNARPGTPGSNALYSMSLVLLVFSVGVVLVTRALSKRGAR